MRRTLGVLLATLALACAPTVKTTVVVDEPIRETRSWDGPTLVQGQSRVDGDDVIVSVELTRACKVERRQERLVEDRERRGVSLGMVVPGALLGSYGVVALADPGPSCKSGEMCVVDGRDMNVAAGALLVLSGLALAIGGAATIKDERDTRIELGPPDVRRVAHCSRHPGAGFEVRLALASSTEVVATSDPRGLARLRVAPEIWAAGAGQVSGTLYVDGRNMGLVRLAR